MTYEQGSQVALGLDLCKRMDVAHVAAGRHAYAIGDISGLWSALHWAGYNAAAAEDGVSLLTGDPTAASWYAAGSPTCSATWVATPARLCYECGGEIQGDDHQDDDGHYYHEACCPGCIAEFYVDPDSVTF